MASTLGHALCGIDCLMIGRMVAPHYVTRFSVPLVFAAVFLANAPDLDLLVGPMIGEHHHYFHGQATHSIVFALLAGALFWVTGRVFGIEENRNRFFALLVGFGLMSHVAVDWFTGPNPGWNPSFGTVVLWPFVDARIHSPLTLFLGPHHGSMDEFLSLHNLWVMVREVIIFGGFGLIVWLMSKDIREQTKRLVVNVFSGNFR